MVMLTNRSLRAAEVGSGQMRFAEVLAGEVRARQRAPAPLVASVHVGATASTARRIASARARSCGASHRVDRTTSNRGGSYVD